ncbi:unnamed protein product [Gadus morhua 'NCC']
MEAGRTGFDLPSLLVMVGYDQSLPAYWNPAASHGEASSSGSALNLNRNLNFNHHPPSPPTPSMCVVIHEDRD